MLSFAPRDRLITVSLTALRQSNVYRRESRHACMIKFIKSSATGEGRVGKSQLQYEQHLAGMLTGWGLGLGGAAQSHVRG